MCDAQHVRCARSAERHAGNDDGPLAGFCKPFAEGDAAGAVHHVVEIARVRIHDAVHAPNDREPPTGA